MSPRDMLLKPSIARRAIFFLVVDTALLVASFFVAYQLRFGFVVPPIYMMTFVRWLPVVVGIKLLCFGCLRLYTVSWQFISLVELCDLVIGTVIASAAILLCNMLALTQWGGLFIPRGVLLIDTAVGLVFLGGFRVSKRMAVMIFHGMEGRRTLIVGAGALGEMLVRNIQRGTAGENVRPVAFVDDDPLKQGTHIHAVPVLSSCADVRDVVASERVEAAIITLPPGSHRRVREVFLALSEAGVSDVKVAPCQSQFRREAVAVHDMKDIKLEDLLPRPSVRINCSDVEALVNDQVVLVTGAGGSIGSEIVRQLFSFAPRRVIAFEIDETELHNLMQDTAGKELVPFLGDIRDRHKLETAFHEYRPTIVFHAAAYKHVPMLEWFPEEAVHTNILGTYQLAEVSAKYGVRMFVNISTDKAVNPTSMMGATKRVAEYACSAFNRQKGRRYVSVRFGNVLGSRGSVVPLFLKQIKQGGPVTVTHPEMKRYFMSIPEAVLLVFQAASMGSGGEVFVLDMGEPARIVKIAEDLIRLHGFQPYRDIDIAFSGMRPGEKLFEELLTAEEGTSATAHEKIFVAHETRRFTRQDVQNMADQLLENEGNPESLQRVLRRHVSFFTPVPAATGNLPPIPGAVPQLAGAV